jgi:long-subunit fatty acid transport protein
MKKVILSLVAVMAFGFANAQDVKYGAKAGLGLSSVSGLNNGKSLIGFNIGGFAEIGLDDKFSFQPELLFTSAGAKSSYSEISGGYKGSYSLKLSFSHINIPLMLKYKVADKISLEAGPQIGFLIGTKSTEDLTVSNNGTTIQSSSNSSTDKSGWNKTAFGLNIGGGYDLTENLNLGLRYSLGLSKLQKDVAAGESSLKNNVLWLNLGYKF